MKFEIRRSKHNQQYRAYIVADNGLKLFMSEQYTTFGKAVKAIRLIDVNAPIDLFGVDGNWTRTIAPKQNNGDA